MKKLAIIAILFLAAGGYFLLQKSQNPTASIPSPNTNSSGESNDTTPTSSESAGAGSGQNVAKTYKDGTYTGDTTDAFYGMIQVQIVVQNGKISDVTFPQFPNNPGHTTEVSNQALPLLKQETIQKQSTPVDIISGATQTSDAFNQSLASALTKAQ